MAGSDPETLLPGVCEFPVGGDSINLIRASPRGKVERAALVHLTPEERDQTQHSAGNGARGWSGLGVVGGLCGVI